MVLLLALSLTDARAEAPEYRHCVGVKAVSLNALETSVPDEVTVIPYVGGGPFYEFRLVPERLELEISVPFVTSNGAHVLPVDVQLKTPVALSEQVEAFVGLGPALAVRLGEGGVGYGLSSAVGINVWLSEQLGLDMAVDYNLLKEATWVNEVSASVGPAWQF